MQYYEMNDEQKAEYWRQYRAEQMAKYYRKFYIYGLADPESDTIRYVGHSFSPQSRYNEHINRQPSPVGAWARELISKGTPPKLVIIEEVDKEVNPVEREWYWYNKLLESNCLLNNAKPANSRLTMNLYGSYTPPQK